MKTMKKLLEIVLLAVCVVAFLAMCAEYPAHQFLWSMGWCSVLAVCARILDGMGCFKKGGAK